MSLESTAPAPQNETTPVIIVSLVTALCLLGDSMLYVALPIYWREVGLVSLGEVGLLLSVNRMIRLPLYPLVDKFYSRVQLPWGLMLAVALAVLSTTGYGIWQGLGPWLILRSLWGTAWTLLRLGGLITVTHYASGDNRGRLMGTYNGLYRLGSLGGMLAGGILAEIIGFKTVALLFGSLSAIGVPLIYFFVAKNQPSTGTKEEGLRVKARWTAAPVLRVIVSGFFIAMLIRGLLNSTLSLLIEHNFGTTVAIVGLTVGAAALAGLIQSARWMWEPFLAVQFGRWSDGPQGRLPLLFFFLFLSALGFLLLPLPLPLFLWLPIIILILISATALTTLVDALAADVARDAATLSVLTASQIAADLGSALGPLLSYQLIQLQGGFLFTYCLGALSYLLVALIWYQPFRSRQDSAKGFRDLIS
jgi:MFS family permease